MSDVKQGQYNTCTSYKMEIMNIRTCNAFQRNRSGPWKMIPSLINKPDPDTTNFHYIGCHWPNPCGCYQNNVWYMGSQRLVVYWRQPSCRTGGEKFLSVRSYIRGLSNQPRPWQGAIFLIFGPIIAWKPFVTDYFSHRRCGRGKHALRARKLSPTAASSHSCRQQVKKIRNHNRLQAISWRGYVPRIIPHRSSKTTRPAITVTGMAIWRFARYHAYDRKVSGREVYPRCERTNLGSVQKSSSLALSRETSTAETCTTLWH